MEVSAETVEEKRQTCQDDRMEPERVLERMEQAGTYKRALEYLREEKPLWYQVVCMAYLEEKSNRKSQKSWESAPIWSASGSAGPPPG